MSRSSKTKVRICAVLLAIAVVAFAGWKSWQWHNIREESGTREMHKDFVEVGKLSIQPYQFPVALSADKKRLLLKEKTGSAFAFRVYEGDKLLAKLNLSNPQWEVSWNPDGTAVSFLAEVGDVPGVYAPYVWWLNQNHEVTLNGPTMSRASFAFKWSPDGRYVSYIAVTPEDKRLIVLRVQQAGSALESVVENVYPEAGMAWSPRGDALVFARQNASGFAIMKFNLKDKTIADLDQVPEGKIKDIAWSPSSSTIAISFRGEKDNFYRLALLSIHGRTRYCSAEDGDVLSPLEDNDGNIVKFVLEKNSKQSLLIGHGCERPSELYISQSGSIRLQNDGYSHRPLPLIEAEPDGPAQIIQPSFAFRPGQHSASPISISSRSATQLWIPGPSHPIGSWIWEPPTGTTVERAVVMVHGGPHLHEVNEWEPLREALRLHGYIVLTPNYGGSSGYGKKYEDVMDLDTQSDDILAAIQYLIAERHLSPQHITVLSSSYGTRVVLRALRSDPNLSPLIIFAPFLAAPSDIGDPIPFHGTVLAFHGRRDPISNPVFALHALQTVFPEAVLRKKLYWREFDDEAHGSNRISSLQEEYGTIICVLETSSCKVGQ